MGNRKPHLYIAIPAMNELDFLPATLEAIERQVVDYDYSIYICINQPDSWWHSKEDEKIAICENNRQLLLYLANYQENKLHILDYSSSGRGWKGKRLGVGWARKILFDTILNIADNDDIIISLDADTLFSTDYFQTVGEFFELSPTVNALSVPYFHKLTDDEKANLAILRYEIYMRSHLINMFLIGSPYAFTAIGSAIALRARSLRKIGGITPMKSGEDFYLLQKLRKMDYIHQWITQTIYPAARFSNRVFFGTGPAMIKGAENDWTSYPIYHYSLFNEIQKNYNLIPQLYHNDFDTIFINFLKEQFQDKNLWQPLRKNAKTLEQFTKSFHQKADGLRILQFLKIEQKKLQISDEEALRENFQHFFQKIPEPLQNTHNLNSLSIETLNTLRQTLFDYEQTLRQRRDKQ